MRRRRRILASWLAGRQRSGSGSPGRPAGAVARTTGGQARALIPAGALFDQGGAEHRDARRTFAADLSATGIDRLRPAWRSVLAARLAELDANGELDVAAVAAELAGATVCALLGLDADPMLVARTAGAVAVAAARGALRGTACQGSACRGSACRGSACREQIATSQTRPPR